MNWVLRLALAVAAAVAGNSPAAAATVLILTDPMTLERRTVVLETPGPDRFLLCMAPPAMSGCRDVTASLRR